MKSEEKNLLLNPISRNLIIIFATTLVLAIAMVTSVILLIGK